MKTRLLFLLLAIILTVYSQEISETNLALKSGEQLRLDQATLPRDVSASVTKFLGLNTFGLNRPERVAVSNFMSLMIMDVLKAEKSQQYNLKQAILKSWNALLGEKDMPGVQPLEATNIMMVVILEGLRSHHRTVIANQQKAAIRSSLPESTESSSDMFSDDETEE